MTQINSVNGSGCDILTKTNDRYTNSMADYRTWSCSVHIHTYGGDAVVEYCKEFIKPFSFL